MIPIPSPESDAIALAAVMCGQGRGFYSAKEEETEGKNKVLPRRSQAEATGKTLLDRSELRSAGLLCGYPSQSQRQDAGILATSNKKIRSRNARLQRERQEEMLKYGEVE